MPPTIHKTVDEAAGIVDGDGSSWHPFYDGPSWTWPATPVVVTYGFRDTATYDSGNSHDNYNTFFSFSSEQKAYAQLALTLWSEVAGIKFEAVNPNGTTNNATMLFANYSSIVDGAGGFARGPAGTGGDTSAESPQGDVWVNEYSVTRKPGVSGLGPASYDYHLGNFNFYTLLHETGHALGLEHPGGYAAGFGVETKYAGDAEYIEDSKQYTLMSYFDASNTGADHGTVDPMTPLLVDIRAIQNLYGANTSTRKGDTVYGFNSTEKKGYDFNGIHIQSPYDITNPSAAPPVWAIWDTGGIDTLDFSGYSENQHIRLGYESFSDVGGLTGNIAIAFGVDIEHAKGGSGRDIIDGNKWNNVLSGNAGDDTLSGDNGNDELYGGENNDWLYGEDGQDKLYGGNGNDHLFGGVGDYDFLDGGEGYDTLEDLQGSGNRLFGGGGGDTLISGNGSDRLYGEAGNDWIVGMSLVGGGGDDYIDGGIDDDTVDYHLATSSISVRLGGYIRPTGEIIKNGGASGAQIGSDTLIGIENVIAGSGDDRLTGDDRDNRFVGGGGNDTIDGGGGNDTADYSGTTRGVTVHIGRHATGAFTFSFTGSASGAEIGKDTLIGIENVIGGSGKDTLIGDGYGNRFVGGAGDDTIDGAGGIDTIDLSATTRGVRVLLLEGSFVPAFASGAEIGTDFLTSIENVIGGSGGDTLIGSDEKNLLNGGAGVDDLTGKGGDDTYIVDNQKDTVNEEVGGGYDRVLFRASTTSVAYFLQEGSEVEYLAVENSAGKEIANLFGNEFANVLIGNNGSNMLSGAGGADEMRGLGGNDQYFVENARDRVIEAVGGGMDEVSTSVDFVLEAGSEIETLKAADPSALTGLRLTGNEFQNIIIGNDGNNIIDGGGGVDTLTGGKGFDQYIVDRSWDTIVERPNEGVDVVFASASYSLSANVENLILTGTGNIDGTGNELVNYITGNSGANVIDGGAGADVLDGRAGIDTVTYKTSTAAVLVDLESGIGKGGFAEQDALSGFENIIGSGYKDYLYGNSGNNVIDGGEGVDRMLGRGGDDTYTVDNAGDLVIEGINEGIDTVLASVSHTLRDNVENLTMLSTVTLSTAGGLQVVPVGNISATGNALGNKLTGNLGNNRLDGGDGNDILDGGKGADTLIGGKNNDTFVFKAGEAHGDTVLDFAGNGAGVGDTFKLVGFGTAAQGATFTHVGTGNTWQIHSGLDGHNEIITLGNGASVHASDFLFV